MASYEEDKCTLSPKQYAMSHVDEKYLKRSHSSLDLFIITYFFTLSGIIESFPRKGIQYLQGETL